MFRAETKLKQATITYMASNLASKKDQAQLRETFKMFDKDGNGKIEFSEFLTSYQEVYKDLDPTEVKEEAHKFFDAIDTDGNGFIDFTEWCAATIDKHKLINEVNLRAAFELFDKDKGGTISTQEVAEILGRNSCKDETVWEQIIKEVDQNGDGEIDFKEFKQMVSGFLDDNLDGTKK